MTGRALHVYQCFLRGIRDPETVEELWREKLARQERKVKKKPRGNRTRGHE